MRKQIELLLLSLLVGLCVLLGLTFWLNINFSFNLFSSEHWHELALLQASGEPININFYISIGIALFIFIICLNVIYHPHLRKIKNLTTNKDHIEHPVIIQDTEQQKLPVVIEQEPDVKSGPEKDKTKNEPSIQHVAENSELLVRPQKLNLPKNMAEIAAAQYTQQKQNMENQNDKYDAEIDKIFSDNLFIVKKKPKISGFTPNLFALGADEIIWIGGVDCDIDKLNKAIERLESTFEETLEDITIIVNAFLIDTVGKYNSDDRIHIFHSIDELKQYISENPGNPIDDSNREDFDAYSDYIDTVLTLLYKT